MDIRLFMAAIAGLLWLLFIIVWLISALSAKRTIKQSYSSWVFRFIFVVIALVAIRNGGSAYLMHSYWWQPSMSLPLDVLGLVLIALGIATAVWARYHLARNWGMPMTHKEGAELVTTGPYAYIRNPIYTGMILAMIGSAFALGAWWLFVAFAALCYFIYASIREEAIMLQMFPDTYPAYRARTKMLIPFIL